MTVRELYYKVVDKVNKLVTNSPQNIPYHIVVLNFNEQQLHWVENCYKVDEKNKSEIHKIQQLLEEKDLTTQEEGTLFISYDLPSDYFKYSSSYSNINKCPFIIENHLKESHNKIALYKNPDWTPSIQFEETFVVLANNKLQVAVNQDLKPKSVTLNYYRFPKEINIGDGYKDFENKQTKDIDPEWTGSNLEEIIDLTASAIAGNYGDQLAKQTLDQHINQTQIRL